MLRSVKVLKFEGHEARNTWVYNILLLVKVEGRWGGFYLVVTLFETRKL